MASNGRGHPDPASELYVMGRAARGNKEAVMKELDRAVMALETAARAYRLATNLEKIGLHRVVHDRAKLTVALTRRYIALGGEP